MGTARADRRRPHRVHRARPGARRARFLVDVLGCEYLYSLGPFVHDDSDWMAEHLNVHPRAVMRRNSLLPLRRPGDLRGLLTTRRPTRTPAPPRNSDVGGHHVALYVDDLDAAVAHLREHGVTVLGEPTASSGAARGPALGLLPRALGHAVRAGQLPGRQGVLPRTREAFA